MTWKTRYENAKSKLLNNSEICKANRDIFNEFFDYQEYKLRRQNNLSSLDIPCYKTLYKYITMLQNVNSWFKNKPWIELTKSDIKDVYDGLEDGRILTSQGQPFKDRSGYYNKVFKSKPFRIAGKSELAKEVMEFRARPENRVVRFITEDTFKKMVSVLSNPVHLFLFWLAWDIGENIGALLQLTKKDFVRQKNPDTGEGEYLVNLPSEKIKRSRLSRSEPTLYPETVKFADMVLENLKRDDVVFEFGDRQALKVMHSVVAKSGAKCMPNNDSVSWKDLRSGMACHLMKSGWTREEVDARLGHKPSSRVLDVYINYLAIDRHKPKKRLYTSNLQEIQNELEEAKRREKLTGERVRRHAEDNEMLRGELRKTRDDLKDFKKKVERILAKVA